jgi:hypothetical protein
VAAAQITGVIALLMSASPKGLGSATVLSLLHQDKGPGAAAEPPLVDVNAALARLDATQTHVATAADSMRPTHAAD